MFALREGLNNVVMFSLKYPNIIKNVSICITSFIVTKYRRSPKFASSRPFYVPSFKNIFHKKIYLPQKYISQKNIRSLRIFLPFFNNIFTNKIYLPTKYISQKKYQVPKNIRSPKIIWTQIL